MNLSGQQREKLKDALIDAFRDKASLEQMLSYKLNKNLNEIAPNSNLQNIVFKLIQTVEAEGWVEDLVRAALEANPRNKKLLAYNAGLARLKPSDPHQEITGSQSTPQNESLHENINTNELVQTARDNIRPYIETRCGTMRVLDMTQPIRLDDIYTDVNILNKTTKSKRSSTDELLKNANCENIDRIRLGVVPEKRIPGLEAVARYSQLMILGKPGSGKTTFLKHIALQCINGNFENTRIPLFVTLKDFAEADSQPSLLEYLTQTFPDIFKNSQVVKQLIKQGKLLVLLDGLDEVQQVSNKRIVNQIEKFTFDYSTNKLVITCRVAASEHIFENFTDVEIADFDSNQIKTVALKWFTIKNNTSNVQEFISELERYKPIEELAITPILLTLLCLVFEEKNIFPKSRAKLYEEGIDILLKKWDASRSIERNQLPYKNLSKKQRKDLLSQIAYHKFWDGKYFFSPEEVEEYIIQYYKSLNIKDDIETEKVLQSIEAQHGLLVERAQGIYSFSHLTLQEYFTANYVYHKHETEKLVTEHLTDKRWKEVFLLVAGLMWNGADNLLLSIEKEAQKDINIPKLQALFKWAEQVITGSLRKLKPVGKRAIGLVIAIAYAEAKTNIIAIANANAIAIAIAIANEKAIANPKAIADPEAKTNGNTNTIAIANIIAQVYTEANIIVIANAKANANTIADAIANDEVIANVNAIANAYNRNGIGNPEAKANANDEAINYTPKLKELTIFNNADFTMLINRLNELKNKVPDEKQLHKVPQKFVQSLQETLLNVFNLSPDIINLSKNEIKALENYLYGNNLLIQCKKASVRVSPQTWEAIEARMLLW